jgi:integrase
MGLSVVVVEGGHRLGGDGPIDDLANRYLSHLGTCRFSLGTVRGYAFDLLNFSRFLVDRRLSLGEVRPSDLFDWLEWQSARPTPSGKVVRLDAARGPAPATINRRVAAVRGLFEYALIVGEVDNSPVPAARRSTGWRAPKRGMLAHVGPGRARGGGRLVRQPRRLPESVDPVEVAAFIADLGTHRDRAMALVMVLGGLRAGEVRSLLLADVDVGLGRVRVTGKGGRERVVPVDRAFFTETAAYLAGERPAGCATPQCFVVLRGSDRRRRDDRGGTAQDLPFASRDFGRGPGQAAPLEAHLRDRARRGGRGPAGAAGADGTRIPGDDRRLRAPLGRRDRGGVRDGPGEGGPVTPAAAAKATIAERSDHYADYLAHLGALNIGADAKRLRRNGAGAFLARHPDLGEWMGRPIADRVADISRSKAWPFVCWAILTRRVAPDASAIEDELDDDVALSHDPDDPRTRPVPG